MDYQERKKQQQAAEEETRQMVRECRILLEQIAKRPYALKILSAAKSMLQSYLEYKNKK